MCDQLSWDDAGGRSNRVGECLKFLLPAPMNQPPGDRAQNGRDGGRGRPDSGLETGKFTRNIDSDNSAKLEKLCPKKFKAKNFIDRHAAVDRDNIDVAPTPQYGNKFPEAPQAAGRDAAFGHLKID